MAVVARLAVPEGCGGTALRGVDGWRSVGPGELKAFIRHGMITTVGNGSNTKFWFDQEGKYIAPNLLAIIPPRIINKRMVQQTSDIQCWLGDIKGPLSVTVLVEYLHLGLV